MGDCGNSVTHSPVRNFQDHAWLVLPLSTLATVMEPNLDFSDVTYLLCGFFWALGFFFSFSIGCLVVSTDGLAGAMKRSCNLHLLAFFFFFNCEISSPVRDKVCGGGSKIIWEVDVEKVIISSAFSLIKLLLIKVLRKYWSRSWQEFGGCLETLSMLTHFYRCCRMS